MSGSFAFDYFLGLDWSEERHDLVIVDRQGAVVFQGTIEETRAGWEQLRQTLASFGNLAATLETSSGWVVERLLEIGLPLYPVNPKMAERFRERKAAAGGKTDRLDAYCLADALRTDGQRWRPLLPQSALASELRLLCRDETDLIAERTALILQLRQALREYYPAALDLFEDLTAQVSWEFVRTYPTPHLLHQAGPKRFQQFLKKHHLPTGRTDERLSRFPQGQPFTASPATVAAKSRLASSLVDSLTTLQRHLAQYRQRIEELFQSHQDHDLYQSLPGLGEKLAPRLLAEIGDNRDLFAGHQDLQAYVGTAPVTKQSGKTRWVQIRYACNKRLRAVVHLWAKCSLRSCTWARSYYNRKISEGKKHSAALRCLGQRWLKILWTMWQRRTVYDEALHLRHQTERGTWSLQLQPSP